MDEIRELIPVAKEAARRACQVLCEQREELSRSYRFSDDTPREMKALADCLMEERIVADLESTGLPIFSEESGEIGEESGSALRWVVDPLDGTVNFIRGLGEASVSIALCRGDEPVFGAVGMYPTGGLAWGGPGMGTFVDGREVTVSAISVPGEAILCTGFPARFDFEGDESVGLFMRTASRYAKIRMLGAASISLVQVAKGSAEAYAENNIMLWDVAAGLALVQGAGGLVSIDPVPDGATFNVTASNGRVGMVRAPV